ncbi:MAG: aminoacyl-tRNA hydrolase [Anaerolineaceae bacterium]
MNLLSKLFPPSPSAAASTFVIAGLGNPGRDYRDNRHNVGFMTIDRLGEEFNIRLSKFQSRAITGSGLSEGSKLILAKPQTFMNLSGEAVAALVRFYKIPLDHLLVIHDDLDLPFGTIRMRPTGGSGGQKGLVSIINRLGSEDFPRLRIGIGRPGGQISASDYVLQNFSNTERKELEGILDTCLGAVKLFITSGMESAMNKYNGAV